MSDFFWSQLIWLGALSVGSFLVSWIFSDLLNMPRRAYIAVFAVITGAVLYGYLQWSHVDWATFIGYQWLRGLIVGLAGGLALIVVIPWLVRWQSLSRLPAPGPQGMQLVRILLIDGVVNGAAEAMLLSVLPVLIVWQAFSSLHWWNQWPGIALVSMMALAASLLVVTLHHLGFRELRGHLIIYVILGNAVFTVAYLLTVNPLAAVIAHVLMHLGCEFQRIEVPLRQVKGTLAGKNSVMVS